MDIKNHFSTFIMYTISCGLVLKSIYFSSLDELRKLQEQMKSLQEQLKLATIKQPASPARLHKTPGNQTNSKDSMHFSYEEIITLLLHPTPGKMVFEPLSKFSLLISFIFNRVDKSPRPPLKEKKVQRIQESSRFSAELDVPTLPKPKRVARTPKVSPAGVVLEASLVSHCLGSVCNIFWQRHVCVYVFVCFGVSYLPMEKSKFPGNGNHILYFLIFLYISKCLENP